MIIRKKIIKTETFARILGEIIVEDSDFFAVESSNNSYLKFNNSTKENFSEDFPVFISRTARNFFFLTISETDVLVKNLNTLIKKNSDTLQNISIKLYNPFAKREEGYTV